MQIEAQVSDADGRWRAIWSAVQRHRRLATFSISRCQQERRDHLASVPAWNSCSQARSHASTMALVGSGIPLEHDRRIERQQSHPSTSSLRCCVRASRSCADQVRGVLIGRLGARPRTARSIASHRRLHPRVGTRAEFGAQLSCSATRASQALRETFRLARSASMRRRRSSSMDTRTLAIGRVYPDIPRQSRVRARYRPWPRPTHEHAVTDDVLAAHEHRPHRARHGHPLVGREVARVVQVRLADDPPGRRVEQHQVGVAADLDGALGGHPEQARRGRRQQVDQPLQRDAAAAHAGARRSPTAASRCPGAPFETSVNGWPV